MKDEHTCLQVNSNKDVTSSWLGTEYGELLRANQGMKFDVLKNLVLKKHDLEITLFTLYRAKRYVVNTGNEEYKIFFIDTDMPFE